MLRKNLLVLLLLFIYFGFAYAQMPKELDVSINVEANIFELRDIEKSDVKLRREAGRNVGQTIALPFSDRDWFSGTGISFSYDKGFIGGAFSLNVTTSDQKYYDKDKREWFDLYPVHAGAMNAWLKPFNDLFRISIGRGIASGFADAQGADGLRIFAGGVNDNWDSSRSIDDVVQDEGILLEGFFGHVSLALAGRYYKPSLYTRSMNAHIPGPEQNTQYGSMVQRNFSYGARIGSVIGEFAKLSVSYIIEYDNATGDNYNFEDRINREGKLVPTTGEAEFRRHLYAVFVSMYPVNGLGISVSYNGILTQYPKQILGATEMVNLTMPNVFQHAANLNLRYTGLDRWVFRTDHNVSFWGDKNFRIFHHTLEDSGLTVESPTTIALPTVGHLLIWNGLGVSFNFTDTFKLELYARNLHRRDRAEDPGNNIDYFIMRNKTEGWLKALWQPGENLELFIGVKIENTITEISRGVSLAIGDIKDGFTLPANAREIRDTELAVMVPVGITIKIR